MIDKTVRPMLLTSRDKYENSFWMEQLPAHIWVQNSENEVVFSNRLPVNQLAVANKNYCRAKKTCCNNTFMGEKKTCPCCPHQRITNTLQAESCVCRRDKEMYHVYHFPFDPQGNYDQGCSPHVLKIEINVGNVNFNKKRAGCEMMAGAGTKLVEKAPAAPLVKICSACKKVRDDNGSWQELEKYFSARQGLKFSHGTCEECACRLYPDIWAVNP